MNFIIVFWKFLLSTIKFWNQKYGDPFKKIDVILIRS